MRGTPVHVQPSQFPRKRLSRELWSSVSSTNKYWGLEAQSSLSSLEWTKLTCHNEIRETHNLTRACIYKIIMIILHSALSFNLPLELHASEYESGHTIEFTTVIGIGNQGEISRSVWGYFEVVMTVRNATTMRIIKTIFIGVRLTLATFLCGY